MLVSPQQEFNIKSDLSRDQIKNRISGPLEKQYKSAFRLLGFSNITWTNDYDFTVSKWIGEGLCVIITATVHDRSVTGISRWSRPTTGTLALFLVIPFIILSQRFEQALPFAAIFFLFTIFFCGYMVVGTRYQSRKFEKLITTAIQE